MQIMLQATSDSTSMREKNDGGEQEKNCGPDESTQFKLGAQKYLHISQVLDKCHFKEEEDYNPNRLVGCNEIKVSALVNLWNGVNVEQPVFVKFIHWSCANPGFFLKIPVHFCRRYLPAVDTLITLETRRGKLYVTKYLPRDTGLSGGWKNFAINQKLVKGDHVVFHLVEATRFQVYIITKGSSTVKLPSHLLNLFEKAGQRVPKNNQLTVYKRFKVHQSTEDSNGKKRDENCSGIFEVKICFSNIKGFKDFDTVMSETLLQNQQVSDILLHEYYELCRAQNAFLHTHLCKGLNPTLFLGYIKHIIFDAVSIGVALRTCTVSTFLAKYSEWTKILTYSEAVGMNVSLLSGRLEELRQLAVGSDGAVSRSKYIEACRERSLCECEVKKLDFILGKWREVYVVIASEVKVLESRPGWEKYLEAYSRLSQAKDEIREIEVLIQDFGNFFRQYDAVIETLKLKADRHELRFQQAAYAPWSDYT